MKTEKIPKFMKECQRVSDETDVSMYWERHGDRRNSVVEDDGALIIEKGFLFVVFSIGQDRPLREQNERITAVLKGLKMDKHLAATLWSEEDVDEEEREDDVCECCGRRG